MQLLMFSGNSLRNKDWIYEAREQFVDLFDSTYIQDYKHWETDRDWIDLPYELDTLRSRRASFDPAYGVFAKSIGTVLAVLAIDSGIIEPRWLLLCGLPLDYIQKQYPEFSDVLAKSKVPVVIVHNTRDRVGTAAAAKSYMEASFLDRKDYTFIETPGDTHDYEDYALLRKQLISLRG